jgi:electron transfer flavoprotein beta subunit
VRIVVVMKDVPDLVEDLEIREDEQGLEVDALSFVPSEWDEQALEEALLLKEEGGGAHHVTVVAIDTGDVDNMLYTALAKGADEAVKLVGDFDRTLSNRARAHILAGYLKTRPSDLILTGVQAVDDLDGQLQGWLAGLLEWPHASVVRDVSVDGATVGFVQEYAGGRMARFSAAGPLLLGIQAARKPPRYVPIARVRQVSKTSQIVEVEASSPAVDPVPLKRLYRPESAGRAVMWDGDVDAVAEELIKLLAEKKVIGG